MTGGLTVRGADAAATGMIARIAARRVDVSAERTEHESIELSRHSTLAVAISKTHRQGLLIEKCE